MNNNITYRFSVPNDELSVRLFLRNKWLEYVEKASQTYIETERELRQKAHRGQFGDIISLFSFICFFPIFLFFLFVFFRKCIFFYRWLPHVRIGKA